MAPGRPGARKTQPVSRTSDIDDLLFALMDGPFEHPLWSTFLDQLRARTDADYASLIFRPLGLPSNTVFHLFSGERSPPVVQQLYRESFYKRDPTPYHEMVEGRIYSLNELLRQDNPFHKEYMREVMAPSGMNAMRMVRLVERSGVNAWLTVTQRERDFGTKDDALLSEIAPYLRRVLRGFIAAERERINALLASEASQRLNVGWLMLDASGRVLETDVQGSNILEKSDILRRDSQGFLKAASSKQTREINESIAALTGAPNARPRAVILSRDPWFDMLLVPANRSSISAKSVPAIVAYVHGDTALSADRCEQIGQLFELLPSEARLALALSRGMSIAEAAEELGLTVETARTYTKSIYAKMGARGQADLVRFIHRSVIRIV